MREQQQQQTTVVTAVSRRWSDEQNKQRWPREPTQKATICNPLRKDEYLHSPVCSTVVLLSPLRSIPTHLSSGSSLAMAAVRAQNCRGYAAQLLLVVGCWCEEFQQYSRRFSADVLLSSGSR